MHRLSGYDAAFIYDERPNEPQHTLKISIWGREASAHYTFENSKRLLRARLGVLPPLRWRALRVPFDLHHPVWVDDPDLDLDYHVRRLAIPAPADRRALCDVISELASQPLDPKRPLWELWLLEGYEGDKVVAVLKLSHALADGSQSRRLIEQLYSEQPLDPAELDARPAETAREALPSRAQLVRDALRDRVRDLAVEGPRQLRASWAARRRLRAAKLRPSDPSLFQLQRTRTPFCGPLSRRRAFHFTSVSLAEAKEIRKTFGCTINDVVLATAAGAIRRYLHSRRALPGLPILALMPASLADDGARERWGNRITYRSLALPTHVADPVARLRAVSQATTRIKADLAARAGANLEDWLRWLPPSAPKTLSRTMRALVRLCPKSSAGVTVSNVPGPRHTLYTLGGPVENFISVGHMKYAAGLNMTVWSYADQLNVGLYTCGEAFPDLWRVADCVNESFEELRKAAAHEAARVA